MVERTASNLVVWLVEDNDLYRSTIVELLRAEPGIECSVAVPTAEAAIAELAKGARPNIVLMDIGLPGMSGIEACRQIGEVAPDARILMLTVNDDRDTVYDAVLAGASGYLLKGSSPERLVEALHEVAAGGAPINALIARRLLDTFARLGRSQSSYGLTPREREILELLVDGPTMQGIAEQLGVSYHTVDAHIRNIYDKLHVHSRSGAVAKALRERLV
jgi:DNA-binding NarL/FixJ family response regulator